MYISFHCFLSPLVLLPPPNRPLSSYCPLNLANAPWGAVAPTLETTALDESTDCQDSAQLLIYIRGIDDNFEITEELFSMESLKGTTTEKDLNKNVMNSIINSG